mgnify:CR=1 FL=1
MLQSSKSVCGVEKGRGSVSLGERRLPGLGMVPANGQQPRSLHKKRKNM